ncbi:MAG: acetylglutamate kinase [Haliangiales bacterium]
MHPSDLLLRFIGSTGSRREASFYLGLFRAERPEAFALIAASAEVLAEACDALSADLRFLARLGLCPVLWLGDPSATPAAPDPDPDHNHNIDRDALAGYRRRLRAQLEPEIRCLSLDFERADSAGAAVTDATRRGQLPIVLAPERAPGAAPFAPLSELAAALGSRKVLLLDRKSGLELSDGTVPSLVDIEREHSAVRAQLSADQAVLLDGARALLADPSAARTVSVTSPLSLLRELFTVRGAGTLLRRAAAVTRHRDYRAVDTDALRQLLEASFERPLAQDFFARPITALYVAEGDRGLAIVSDTPHGNYLSKFAVEQRAQGEGVGRDIWRVLTAAHPRLLWRSRVENPVNGWYEQQCDGMVRLATWQVFWRGLAVEQVPAAVRYVEAAPSDFPLPTHARAPAALADG